MPTGGDVPRDEQSLLREIGVTTNLEHPSYFDLLSLTENEAEESLIRKRSRERANALRKWEQYREDPQVQKLATEIMARVSNAGRVLRDPQRRREYLEQLQQDRHGGFRQRIAPLIEPGQALSPEQLQQLLKLAAELGVPDDAARKVIREVSEGAENPFAALDVARYPNDPAWPTAFDILGVAESTADAEIFRAAIDQQRVRLASAEVPPDQKSRLRRYLSEADRNVASPSVREAYLKLIHNRRTRRFRELVESTVRASGTFENRTARHLIQHARSMRIPSTAAAEIITAVSGFRVEDVGQPMLGVNTGHLFSSVYPGGRGDTLHFTVRNDGAGSFNLTAACDAAWATIEPAACSIESSRDLVVKLLPHRMVPGKPENATITVQGDGPAGAATIQLEAILGSQAPPQEWEVKMAQRAYYVCLAWMLMFLNIPVLMWMFLHNRNRSGYVAFHCMQALFTWMAIFAVTLLLMLVMVSFIESPETPGAQPQSLGGILGMCLGACVMLLLMLFTFIGFPILMGQWLATEPFLFVPGSGHLARFLL